MTSPNQKPSEAQDKPVDERRAKRDAREKQGAREADADRKKRRMDQGADEASRESFPASDPPATNAGSIGGNK